MRYFSDVSMKFFFLALFIITPCHAGRAGGHKLFDTVYCDLDKDGGVNSVVVGPQELRYTKGPCGYIQDSPAEKEEAMKEVEASRTWLACKMEVASMGEPNENGRCTGAVRPGVALSEKFLLSSMLVTLDELEKFYPNAFYMSCLRGGLPIQAAAISRGVNVHLGLLSSRDVTEQREVLCDFDMLPWDKIKEHGNTIVFWDDITDTGQTAAEFLYWCHRKGKLADGVKVVFAFNYGKDGHPHKKGDVRYGSQEGAVPDDVTMRGRIIRRLVEIDRLGQKLPLDKVFVESEEFKQKFQEWEAFFDKTVERAFFTEYFADQWMVLPTGGGNPLVQDKPDVSKLDSREKYDVLLGCPKLASDETRFHILVKQSLLSNMTDESLHISGAGYVFADTHNKDADGKERLVFKYDRDRSDRVLCYAQIVGYEKEQAEFAQIIQKRCGYKSVLAVPCTASEVLRPYPLLPGLREHKPVRQVFQFHPKGKGETLKDNGQSY